MAENVHEKLQSEEEHCLQQLHHEDIKLQFIKKHVHKLQYERVMLEGGNSVSHPAKKGTNTNEA